MTTFSSYFLLFTPYYHLRTWFGWVRPGQDDDRAVMCKDVNAEGVDETPDGCGVLNAGHHGDKTKSCPRPDPKNYHTQSEYTHPGLPVTKLIRTFHIPGLLCG